MNATETIESLRDDLAVLEMKRKDADAMEDSLLQSVNQMMGEIEAYKGEVELLIALCADHGVAIPPDGHHVDINPLLPDGFPGKGSFEKPIW